MNRTGERERTSKLDGTRQPTGPEEDAKEHIYRETLALPDVTRTVYNAGMWTSST